jgi:hypothetical protein
MKKLIAFLLSASIPFAMCDQAQAYVPSVKETVVYTFYHCKNPASWTLNPDNWTLMYPYKVNGFYLVSAFTYGGYIILALKGSKTYGMVYPNGAYSKKFWKAQGCPKNNQFKAIYRNMYGE